MTVAFKQGWIAFLLLAVTLSAQNVPVISPGGILNAAGYNLASTSVAPGSIATIFGTGLSNGTVCVTPCGPSFDKSGVLVPTLAGSSVTFNGIPAPVLLEGTLGPVEIPAVELDDEIALRPDRIDELALHVDVRPRERKAGPEHELEEILLQL